MNRAAFGLLVLLLLEACGDNAPQGPESLDVQPQVVVQGLNYPSALGYVRTANGGLAAGSVLVGLAGNVGERRNSVVLVAPGGGVSRFADETTLASGGRPVVSRPEALDAKGPVVALANFADAVGSVAFLEPGGQPLSAALRNGLLDARDFGFTVTEVRPPNGTVVNEVGIAPQVFLSQPVNPASVTGSRFSLDRVGSSLDPPGHVEFAADNRSMTFIPDGALIPGISYRVNVSTAVRDISGNGLDSDPFTPSRQSFQSTFRVSGQAPVFRVRSVSPADRESDVPLNSRVVVGFTLACDPGSITDNSFFVATSGGQKVPGSISVTSDRLTIIFTPSRNYSVSTQHTINITTDVRDEAGNQFDADPGGDPTPFFSNFTTAGGADTTPPTVRAVDPANGAVAPPQTSVTVTFSEPVDSLSVTANSFRLERAGNRVASSTTVAPDAVTATLTPSSALAEGETFTVIVTTDVADRSGNRLAQAFQSTFSTRGVSVVINEVITDPQRDWNDTTGGNGVPFDGTTGTGAATDTDEWIELHNPGAAAIDISGWTLEMRDSTSVTHVLGAPPATAFEVYSAGASATNFVPNAYVVIGNPSGEINNDVYMVLRDRTNAVVDDVEIGDDLENDGNGDGAPDPGVDGNASSAGDEAVARRPNGADTNSDVRDWDKQPASIRRSNLPLPLSEPSLPGLDGGATGVAYGGPAPDESGPLSQLYFIASSNNEGILAVDLDDAVYQISDFFNPRGLVFVRGATAGTGFLYVVHASAPKATDVSAGSGLTRFNVEPTGPVGSAGNRVRVGASETGVAVGVVSDLFQEPVAVTADPDSGLLYVANRDDGTVLEIEFDGQPDILRVFQTGIPPDRLTAIEFGERSGAAGLFLADDGGAGLDSGPRGSLLFFPLP